MMAEATAESPNIMEIPDEMMIEILCRVEPSNLLQLRCVCKRWKSLVVDPQVIKNHSDILYFEIFDIYCEAMEQEMKSYSFLFQEEDDNVEENDEEEHDDEGVEEEEHADAYDGFSAAIDFSPLLRSTAVDFCKLDNLDDEGEVKQELMNAAAELLNKPYRQYVEDRETASIMQDMEDRIKCLRSFMRIEHKLATSSSL